MLDVRSPPSQNAKQLPPSAEGEPADLFDWALLRDYAGFVVGAVLRHRLLVAVVVMVTVGAAYGIASLWPRTWHVESRLLGQRNLVIATLGNPGRAIPWDQDAPVRAARETVLRRDNLLSLIKQTNLIERWSQTRAPILKLKDSLMGTFRRPLTDEQKVEMMVGLLEKQLTVSTDDGTVTLGVDWPDGQAAYQIVEAAQQNFLETRHVDEISAITDAISILESHAAAVRENIKESLEELERLQQPRAGNAGSVAVARGRAASRPASDGITEQQLNQIRFQLESKRRAIADLEQFRTRRLVELNDQLAEKRVIYSDQHPEVLDIRERIRTLKDDSPQMVALKRDVEELERQYAEREAKLEPATNQTRRTVATAAPHVTPAASLGEDAPEMEYARSQLRLFMAQFQELTNRADAARIELDTARAAFKYRFKVVRPAQVPNAPAKPKVMAILLAGVVASLLLGVVAAVLTDLRRARIVERWQVERILGLQVLADVKRS